MNGDHVLGELLCVAFCCFCVWCLVFGVWSLVFAFFVLTVNNESSDEIRNDTRQAEEDE